MAKLIITTSGVSLFKNTKAKEQGNPTDDQMRHYLRTEPQFASAESNSLLRIGQKDDEFVLLHTKKPDAIHCAELLKEYFLAEKYKNIRLIPMEIHDDPKQIETVGLRSLIEILLELIHDATKEGKEVVINATAGFKSLVVYSTMIGMIHNVPVQYIYEDHKSVITFNPVAVEWDTSLFLSYEHFFKWIDEEPRTQREVESYIRGFEHEEQIKAVLTKPDQHNCVFLSYMGLTLLGRFTEEKEEAELTDWPPSAEIANPDDKIILSLSNPKHHPVKGALAICRKIAAELDCVREIRSERYAKKFQSKLGNVSKESIVLWLSDKDKTGRFIIFTTAESKAQNLKVAGKIKEMLRL